MLTPLEPSIDINDDLSLTLPFYLPDKKSKYQGEFGNVFIDNSPDYYRPNRRPPLKPISTTIGKIILRSIYFFYYNIHLAANSISAFERRYRLCSTLVDQPPRLPSPPLIIDSNERLPHMLLKESDEAHDDESIVSNSPLIDHENLINDIETENIQLLKTLSYNRDLRSLSPVIAYDDPLLVKNSDPLIKSAMCTSSTALDIKTELNDINLPPGGNESEKKDRPLVEGTDKVNQFTSFLFNHKYVIIYF